MSQKITEDKGIISSNMEQAAICIDPYIEDLRNKKGKTHHIQYEADFKERQEMKKSELINKYWKFRSLIPAGLVLPIFYFNIILGFFTLTIVLSFLCYYLVKKVISLKTFEEMTNTNNEDYFHYHAFSNNRGEYDVFSHFLYDGNTFLFKDANKHISELHKLVESLHQRFKNISQQATRLPKIAAEQHEFGYTMSDKLIEKMELSFEGSLSFSKLKLFGHYTVYELQDDSILQVKHSTKPKKQVSSKINIETEKNKELSCVEILEIEKMWKVSRDKSAVSFIAELNEGLYVYDLYFDDKNKYLIDPNQEYGKVNLDKLSDVITSIFKLMGKDEVK